MERKQGQIPGTERQEIEDLTDAAEAYRKVRSARQDLNIKEAEQKAHLQATIDRLIEEGEITLKEDAEEAQVIYRYEDENGDIQDVKYGHGKTILKVNKSKVAHDGDDE